MLDGICLDWVPLQARHVARCAAERDLILDTATAKLVCEVCRTGHGIDVDAGAAHGRMLVGERSGETPDRRGCTVDELARLHGPRRTCDDPKSRDWVKSQLDQRLREAEHTEAAVFEAIGGRFRRSIERFKIGDAGI